MRDIKITDRDSLLEVLYEAAALIGPGPVLRFDVGSPQWARLAALATAAQEYMDAHPELCGPGAKEALQKTWLPFKALIDAAAN